MSAIIYDFKALGAKLRKQGIDDWWQPWKPEPEPKPRAAKGLLKMIEEKEEKYWKDYPQY
jgi:hypothetical protein